MVSESFRVYLMGASLGTGNRGVSALGASLVNLVLNERPDAQVSMLIGQHTSEPFELMVNGTRRRVEVANFRMSPKARLKEHLLFWLLMAILYRCLPSKAWRRFLSSWHPLIRATSEADFIGDIRGGDSFSDIYGVGDFVWSSLPVVAVLLVRRQIVLLPQTYGPFKSRIARKIARYILNRASMIICRDGESLNMVKTLAGADCPASLCPDVAFYLQSVLPATVDIKPPLEKRDCGCLIGLNVSGLMYHGDRFRKYTFGLKLDYNLFVVRLAETLLADPRRHLLLVPHTFAAAQEIQSDPAACHEVWHRLSPEVQNRAHIVTREYDQNEIKGIIGLCDFFVGSRMHACIAALSQGIPTVGIAYSKKFSGVFETVGVGHTVVDGRDSTVEQALQKTLEIFTSRESIRRGLEAGVKQAQKRLSDTFDQLLGIGLRQPRTPDKLIVPANSANCLGH